MRNDRRGIERKTRIPGSLRELIYDTRYFPNGAVKLADQNGHALSDQRFRIDDGRLAFPIIFFVKKIDFELIKL